MHWPRPKSWAEVFRWVSPGTGNTPFILPSQFIKPTIRRFRAPISACSVTWVTTALERVQLMESLRGVQHQTSARSFATSNKSTTCHGLVFSQIKCLWNNSIINSRFVENCKIMGYRQITQCQNSPGPATFASFAHYVNSHTQS